MSILARATPTLDGRKIGALLTDGVDGRLVEALRQALADEGAQLAVIAPRIGGVRTADGSLLPGDERLEGGPSVLFDAVAILGSEAGIAELLERPAARDFVADAFAHHKVVAFNAPVRQLFRKAGLPEDPGAGFIDLRGKREISAFLKACRKGRVWERAV